MTSTLTAYRSKVLFQFLQMVRAAKKRDHPTMQQEWQLREDVRRNCPPPSSITMFRTRPLPKSESKTGSARKKFVALSVGTYTGANELWATRPPTFELSSTCQDQ